MDHELTFRVAAFLLFAGMKVIRYRTQRRLDRHTTTNPVELNRTDVILLKAAGVLLTLSVVIYTLLPSWIAFASLPFTVWLRWIGVGLCMASLNLLASSDRHLGQNFSHTLEIQSDHFLVESGPYRRIRHPIYSSGLLFFVGVFLVSANLLVGACWSSLLILYSTRIPREEAMMIAAFGDQYREYMTRTGRLIPKLKGVSSNR